MLDDPTMLLVDPGAPSQLADAIEEILFVPDIRRRYIEGADRRRQHWHGFTSAAEVANRPAGKIRGASDLTSRSLLVLADAFEKLGICLKPLSEARTTGTRTIFRSTALARETLDCLGFAV